MFGPERRPWVSFCAGLLGNMDYQRAIIECTSAIELNSKNWQAYNNRGYAHYKLGEFEAARADIDRGLKLNPKGEVLLQVKRLLAQR